MIQACNDINKDLKRLRIDYRASFEWESLI